MQPNPYQARPSAQKSKVAAVLFALFFGALGVHRFYLGHTGTGAAMLVLWVVGLATACIYVGYAFWLVIGVWAIIDAILILTDGLGDASGMPLGS